MILELSTLLPALLPIPDSLHFRYIIVFSAGKRNVQLVTWFWKPVLRWWWAWTCHSCWTWANAVEVSSYCVSQHVP